MLPNTPTFGQEVHVLRRDRFGRPSYVYEYVYLTQLEGFAIVVADYSRHLERLGIVYFLDYMYQESVYDSFTRCRIFPLEDLYPTREAALAAMREEESGEGV